DVPLTVDDVCDEFLRAQQVIDPGDHHSEPVGGLRQGEHGFFGQQGLEGDVVRIHAFHSSGGRRWHERGPVDHTVRMAQLAVGDLLEDRYRIDHPIARGGMSMVYRCVDLRLGRAVAAKVLDEKYLADPVFRQRFRREARAMAQLTHPNLVNVYDFGSDGDHLFLIMELITGGTL